MLVTPSGMVILVKLLQPQNAPFPMLVAFVTITSFKLLGTNAGLLKEDEAPNIYPKCVIVGLSNLSPINGSVMLSKLLQPSNADEPILVTLSGMINSVNNSLFMYIF